MSHDVSTNNFDEEPQFGLTIFNTLIGLLQVIPIQSLAKYWYHEYPEVIRQLYQVDIHHTYLYSTYCKHPQMHPFPISIKTKPPPFPTLHHFHQPSHWGRLDLKVPLASRNSWNNWLRAELTWSRSTVCPGKTTTTTMTTMTSKVKELVPHGWLNFTYIISLKPQTCGFNNPELRRNIFDTTWRLHCFEWLSASGKNDFSCELKSWPPKTISFNQKRGHLHLQTNLCKPFIFYN